MPAHRLNTVWVTGAGGLIGSYLVRTAATLSPGTQAVALTRAELDLTDFSSVAIHFRRDAPGAVFHCAALSRSPECEKDPTRARLQNVEVTRVLAELAAEIPFVFFSSDLVFDGAAGPYDEEAPANPLSVYAETKLEAEQIVLNNPRHLVLRTSLNGGQSPTGDRGFNEQMRRAWQNGQTLRFFTDEFRCPIAAEVTARAAWELFQKGVSGLFHVAGAERLSRWEIGRMIADRCPELDPKFEAASLRNYAGAPRSPDTSLDCSRVLGHLSFTLPRFSEWLGNHRELF